NLMGGAALLLAKGTDSAASVGIGGASGGRLMTILQYDNDRWPLKYGQQVSNANLEGIDFQNEQLGWIGGLGDTNFIGDYNSVTEDGEQTWQAEDWAVNAGLQPVGDLRLNANRFRFFGDPVNAGYCSGKKVYDLLMKTGGVASAISSLLATRAVPTTR